MCPISTPVRAGAALQARRKGEYDGFVRAKGPTACCWVLEKRTPARADFLCLVSARSNEKYRDGAVRVGRYLTLGQDANQSPAGDVAVLYLGEGLPDNDAAAHR